MAKRAKRIEKGIESLKEEIEAHFKKIERDIQEDNIDRGRYHIKEIDKSLIVNLEKKMLQLTQDDKETMAKRDLISTLRKKLEEYKKKLSIE
jgi:hypothetical protein